MDKSKALSRCNCGYIYPSACPKCKPSTSEPPIKSKKLTGLICPVCEVDDVYCDCSLKESS